MQMIIYKEHHQNEISLSMRYIKPCLLYMTYVLFYTNQVTALELIENTLGITVARVTESSTLDTFGKTFAETGRFESYQMDLIPKSPLGTYLLFSNTTMDSPIGILSITARLRYGGIESMTNILTAHQGKGLGTKLRQVVLQEISKSPMSAELVYSTNEWNWGHNLESVRSALKCGFRIYSLYEYAGAVNMIYMADDRNHTQEAWSQDRVNLFLSISNKIRNPDKSNMSDPHTKDTIRKQFKSFLDSLNLSLCVDQLTLGVLCNKITRHPDLDAPFDWSATFSDILLSYIENDCLNCFGEALEQEKIADFLNIKNRIQFIKYILNSQASIGDKLEQLYPY